MYLPFNFYSRFSFLVGRR